MPWAFRDNPLAIPEQLFGVEGYTVLLADHCHRGGSSPQGVYSVWNSVWVCVALSTEFNELRDPNYPAEYWIVSRWQMLFTSTVSGFNVVADQCMCYMNAINDEHKSNHKFWFKVANWLKQVLNVNHRNQKQAHQFSRHVFFSLLHPSQPGSLWRIS